jgi:hypothetical protein
VPDRVKALPKIRREHASAARGRVAAETVGRPRKALRDEGAAELRLDAITSVSDVGDPVI